VLVKVKLEEELPSAMQGQQLLKRASSGRVRVKRPRVHRWLEAWANLNARDTTAGTIGRRNGTPGFSSKSNSP
jgi:hypothetical protein